MYRDLRNKDVHSESFPVVKFNLKSKIATADIVEVNSAIWKFKKDNGLSLKDEIAKVVIPETLKVLVDDLKAMHKLKTVEFGKFKIC